VQIAAFIGATTCGIIHLHGYAVLLVVGGFWSKPYRQPHKPFPQEMACAVLVRIAPK
jgi:hypothetical protein